MVIRSAELSDVDVIHDIITYYAQKELILYRSVEEITESLGTFIIAACNGDVAGIISFHDYGFNLKEIRSLAVNKDYLKQGIGSILVKNMIKKLREINSDAKIFVLTYSPEFFIKNDFGYVPKHTLPEKIWKDCQNCRHRDNCGESALVFSRN
jgi:amino-acid N-acetyltransferase